MTFTDRDLSPSLAAVRETHAPDALVLDSARDFETLAPARAEDLGLLVDSLDPVSYPASRLPPDAPEVLVRYAGGEFTVGAPGDGGVAWTRRTDPPVVIVKPRLEGSPESFVDFLVAEALVEVGREVPEQFLGFFEARYADLAAAVRDRLKPRLADLPADLATGAAEFGDAAELACSAIKHGIEPPTPFGALDSPAYREYGADFAVQWAEKTFENLD